MLGDTDLAIGRDAEKRSVVLNFCGVCALVTAGQSISRMVFCMTHKTAITWLSQLKKVANRHGTTRKQNRMNWWQKGAKKLLMRSCNHTNFQCLAEEKEDEVL